jgi:hypothetical protein
MAAHPHTRNPVRGEDGGSDRTHEGNEKQNVHGRRLSGSVKAATHARARMRLQIALSPKQRAKSYPPQVRKVRAVSPFGRVAWRARRAPTLSHSMINEVGVSALYAPLTARRPH